MSKTNAEQWQEWWHQQYEPTAATDQLTIEAFVDWAIETQGADIQPGRRRAILKEEARRALQVEQTYVEGVGKVRRNLNARLPVPDDEGEIRQRWFWKEWLTAGRDFVETAMRQQRVMVADDAIALKRLQDAINSKHPEFQDSPIQLSFDFTPDVNEEGEEEAAA